MVSCPSCTEEFKEKKWTGITLLHMKKNDIEGTLTPISSVIDTDTEGLTYVCPGCKEISSIEEIRSFNQNNKERDLDV